MPDPDLLPEKVDRLADNVATLAEAHNRSRRFARWLAASVALDILLSVGLGYNAVRAEHAIDRAEQASSASRVQCEAANVTNAKTVELWNFAFALGSDPNQTPAQKARTDQFKAYLARTYTQEPC